MAKKATRTKRAAPQPTPGAVSERVMRPEIPAGSEEIEGSNRGGFLNFSYAGQAVKGTLMAITQIDDRDGNPVDRYQFLIDDGSDVVVLPSHYDLHDRLDKLMAERQFPVPGVYIQYLGKQKANTLAGFIQRYAVAISRAKQGTLEGDGEEVPF